MRKATILGTLLLGVMISATALAAEPNRETALLIFAQVQGEQRQLMVADETGQNPRMIVAAKELSVFIAGKHLLYLKDGELFEYFPTTGRAKLLGRFSEKHISLRQISRDPDQAVIAAGDGRFIHGYVLDFSDGSLRKMDVNPGVGSGSAFAASPDQNGMAWVNKVWFNSRLVMTVRLNQKTIWTSPSELSVLPELSWSPDSRWIAFYAKRHDGDLEGFYSLYLLEVGSGKLTMVEEKVIALGLLNEDWQGSATLDWAPDGKRLIFPFQSYGTDNQTGLRLYDLQSGRKLTLTESENRNQFPVWSPTGNIVAFLSTRESKQPQLYLMDRTGDGLRRVASDGYTEWAGWFKMSD
jgi:tricorn protease-like protein